MNYNLKNHSAYYIGTLLERKKIDPIILLEYYLANYKKANTNIKLSLQFSNSSFWVLFNRGCIKKGSRRKFVGLSGL